MNKIFNPTQLKYISSFRKENDDLLKEMEKFAQENNVPILFWQSAEFIEQIVRMINPKRVLELGTAIAYTTIRIARELKGKSQVHTIEKSTDNIATAKRFIQKSRAGMKIKLLEGDALNIMPQLKKKYDFIFLDSDKEDYKRLFDFSMVLLKRGGVIIVDNLLWQGFAASGRVPQKFKESTKHIRAFNKIFMSQPNLKATILPIGDGLGFGIKK
ncbi:MAG: O-methyltransferase [Ignavibacteria bacterium]|nr:O-methyltransferase [Ignavibacteria bacterium]MBT8380914.1 O-methyltransferase [Ignavibacteria bacterium]MBT8391492.1 O-methyltransferase [Ignavibacteria bacterium]NNJ54155.1 O-methyltransferase [Ignavibacteriaceae bacterium]NNL20662.1 O-methyltransferase [Ignavibacteriaceae bacterium]